MTTPTPDDGAFDIHLNMPEGAHMIASLGIVLYMDPDTEMLTVAVAPSGQVSPVMLLGILRMAEHEVVGKTAIPE